MTLDKARERYRDDAYFRHLVDALMSMIHNLQFSPGELREAAVFAEIVYNERVRRHRVENIREGDHGRWRQRLKSVEMTEGPFASYEKNILHVYPENDTIKHNTESEECVCCPRVVDTDEGRIVTHFTKDGRP